MKKVIILDIDGTLLNSQKKISERTKSSLLKAQAQGALLVLASGRPTPGMMPLAQELDMFNNHGLLVSFNGACVTDLTSGEILYNKAMAIEDSQAVLEHIKQFEVIPMIIKDDYTYVNNVYKNIIQVGGKDFNVIDYEAHGNHYKLSEVNDLAAFADFPLNKILLAGDEDYLAAHYKEIAAPFKGKVNSVFTASFYYEFTAFGIDKAAALDSALKPLGYAPEDMIAFGDGQNDKTMLEYVGHGVAMGNAVDELKTVAQSITLDNDHDGIAEELAKTLNI